MTAKSHWREGAIVWRLGWARLRPRLWLALAVVVVGAVCVLLENGWDDALLRKIRFADDDRLNFVAGKLGFWGDWVWNFGLAALLWLAGVVFKRKRWRQFGWACLWAFLVASVAVNVFRTPLGRARPGALDSNGKPANGFYGPHLASKYQGFPSGHTTSSFATAASVLAATPVLGAPCTIYAATVGWSRMQLNRHHPLDVLTGAALGGLVGWCFGSALPGMRWRLRRKRLAS